jgi:uncharacterized protein with PQ loop repeat
MTAQYACMVASMAIAVVSNILQIISLVCLSITLIPQVVQNYRLKSTDKLSAATIILSVTGIEVTLVYLIWTHELPIRSAAYGIFIGISLFIGCQIKYYRHEQELNFQPIIEKSNYRLLTRYLQFIGNYILFLICLLMSGLLLYYIFELTKSHLWISKVIGTVVATIIDRIAFIPQIVLTIRMRSAVGYSLMFIIIDLISAATGIIATCLQENIDAVPLLSFLNLFVFQLLMMILKLCIFPDKKESRNHVQPEYQENNDSNGKYH